MAVLSMAAKRHIVPASDHPDTDTGSKPQAACTRMTLLIQMPQAPAERDHSRRLATAPST